MADVKRDASPEREVNKTFVYEVTRGSTHEGGETEKICGSLEVARAYVAKRLVDGSFLKKWEEIRPNEWVRGWETYEIKRFRVKY
jgi:hypothetical protein